MESFRNRVALITGAASGIGRQLALSLAAEGASVAAMDRQSEGLDRLAGELKGKTVACAVADVTDLSAVRAAVTRLEEQVGPTDLLVASAGIGRETPAESFRAEDFTAHIQVNLIGVINTLDAVLPGMCQRGSGHVAALSSMASYRGLPHMGGYCASKAGLNSLFDALRVELLPKGIAVTTICPAWIRTPLTTPLGLPDKELMDVEEAVRLILAALHARKPFLAFPAGKVWQARLLRHSPRSLSDWLVRQWARRIRKVIR
ncbi:MAG TPA: SDR family NAD(P)-dependent oxidoreductase [Gemmataceae bacterium]|jgi:NAD(P)-dependent dehydrogenase (short-subunit alcohol dehydrogenase family)